MDYINNIAGNRIVRAHKHRYSLRYFIAMVDVDGLFHIVCVSTQDGKVTSALPCDGAWSSDFSDAGIRYVSKGRTRAAAGKLWRKYVRDGHAA